MLDHTLDRTFASADVPRFELATPVGVAGCGVMFSDIDTNPDPTNRTVDPGECAVAATTGLISAERARFDLGTCM